MGLVEQGPHISNTDAGLSTSFAARKIRKPGFRLRPQETVQAVHEDVQKRHEIINDRLSARLRLACNNATPPVFLHAMPENQQKS
jgi:hypothetical protein